MSFFSNLFHKKQPDLKDLDLSVFKTDIHSHLIPGIDDGAQNMDESIAMLAKFESLGYKKVVTTPHIMSDYFKNDSNTILDGLSRLNEVKDKLNLKIEVDAAAEYYYDETLLERLMLKHIFGGRIANRIASYALKPQPGRMVSSAPNIDRVVPVGRNCTHLLLTMTLLPSPDTFLSIQNTA